MNEIGTLNNINEKKEEPPEPQPFNITITTSENEVMDKSRTTSEVIFRLIKRSIVVKALSHIMLLAK